MTSYKPILITLLKQLGVIFIIYQLCRILFFAFNYSAFKELPFGDFVMLCFYGLRFDSFSIAASNALFILLFILPFRFHYNKIYQWLLLFIFIVSNALALSLNFIDMAYFPFTQKRTTYDVSGLIFGGQSDFIKLIPFFLADYWYIILLYMACMYALFRIYRKISTKNDVMQPAKPTLKSIPAYFLIFSLVVGSTVIGIRGGLQKIPIVILDAANYTSPRYIPVLINTPFAFLKSTELKEVQKMNLFDEATLKRIYTPVHKADTGAFKKMNVCVIILESFSKEYTALSGRKSYTPFLDSMMAQSTLYTNAYANAKTSIDGIPAIIAGIPCYLDDKYLNSRYSNNMIESLPGLLKEKGYYSVFFHGGTNGTMNFNSFASMAGYDLYYGRTEYNDETDYDGQWGIFDEPFMKRMVKEVSTYKEPFFVSVFTLTSHNPYKIPDAYKGKFPKGTLEIHESIGYTDYALKQFFNEAKKQAWFKNTLFVITPDHTGVSDDPFFDNPVGQHSIPIAFYVPGQAPQKISTPVQQIDIMPTVLDYLNFDKPYYALGKSMLDMRAENPIVYYTNPGYNYIKDSIMYVSANNKFTAAYNYIKDSLLHQDILQQLPYATNEKLLNAYIQTYTNDLITNNTHLTK